MRKEKDKAKIVAKEAFLNLKNQKISGKGSYNFDKQTAVFFIVIPKINKKIKKSEQKIETYPTEKMFQLSPFI